MTAFLPTVLLTVRLHRFQIVSVVAISALLAAGAVVLAGMLSDVSVPYRCYLLAAEGTPPPECATTQRFSEINNDYAAPLMAAMAVLPFIAGGLLGVALVAREIEQHTASLAWSLSGSRRRWLLQRVLPVGLILVAALGFPAIAAGVLEAARVPEVDPGQSFQDYGLRGPVMVVRGLLAFGLALLAGAVIGRVLPAIIVAGIACIVAFNLINIASPWGQPVESIPSPGQELPGNLYVFTAQAQSVSTDERTPVPGIPGARLREVELRETVVLGLASVALVGASLVVVDRRRPY